MKALFKRGILLLFLLSVCLGGTASANLINGDFASFDGWTGNLVYGASGENADIGSPDNAPFNFERLDCSVTLYNDFDNYGVFIYQDVLIPELATTISFDFDFYSTDPQGEYGGDFFEASLGGLDLLGFDLVSGPVVADISSLAGQLARLQFGLIDFDFLALDSLTVGNIRIATAPVPEPGTLLLLAAGLTGLGVIRYRRRSK